MEQSTDALKVENPAIDTGQEVADVEPLPDDWDAAEALLFARPKALTCSPLRPPGGNLLFVK